MIVCMSVCLHEGFDTHTPTPIILSGWLECTIKDLKDVKFPLGLEELEEQGNVVAFLHVDEPRTHLHIGVAVGEPWTKDDPRGIEEYFVVWALCCRKTRPTSQSIKAIQKVKKMNWINAISVNIEFPIDVHESMNTHK